MRHCQLTRRLLNRDVNQNAIISFPASKENGENDVGDGVSKEGSGERGRATRYRMEDSGRKMDHGEPNLTSEAANETVNGKVLLLGTKKKN